MRWQICAAVLLAPMLGGEALACKGRTVILEDNFTIADKRWDLDDKAVISNGALLLTPDADKYWSVMYRAQRFAAADICVDVKVSNVQDPADLEMRLMFLAESYDTNTYFWLSGNGLVGVKRAAPGVSIALVSQRRLQGFSFANGATNRLRVSYAGNQAEISVNDKKLFDLKTWPVEGGAWFGFGAFSEAKRSNAWAFTNLKVTSAP